MAKDKALDAAYQIAVKEEEAAWEKANKRWIPKHNPHWMEYLEEERVEKRRTHMKRFTRQWFLEKTGKLVEFTDTDDGGFYINVPDDDLTKKEE